jgi:hypothetical protein
MCTIDKYGTKFWTNMNGKLHRDDDLPAIEYTNGGKSWYINGEQRRENDLPTAVFGNGNTVWHINGKLHRLGGLPAIIHTNGNKWWYIYNKSYSYEQVINYYKTLARFGRYCLRKIRMRKLRRLRYIHGELLCMPAKGSYLGGQDYHKMVNYFMSM